MDRLPLFVFGTLRRGQENHHFLAGRFERVLEAVLRDFQRQTAAHGYPAAVPMPGQSIVGELFFLSPYLHDAVLRDCDQLEDLPFGKLVGEYYQRATVNVETAEGNFQAWAYIDPGAVTP